MNRKIHARHLAVSVIAAVLALGGASSLALLPAASAVDYPPPPPPPPVMTPPTPATIQIGTASTSLGKVLTGPNGLTLYTLSSDPNNGSVCTGTCLAAWPPLLVGAGGIVTGPTGVSQTFGTFTRADDGTTQAAAAGRPLYYFASDSAPGQTSGEGITAPGGVWHVAAATGPLPGSAKIHPTVAVRSSQPAGTIPRGTATTFSATVRPLGPTPAKVRFAVYRRDGSVSRLVAVREIVASRTGRATLRFMFARAGSWFVRSRVVADSTFAASGWTPFLRYQVR